MVIACGSNSGVRATFKDAVPQVYADMPRRKTESLSQRASRIQLLLLDVDGVLTDGSIIYADDGTELKRFHVRDGSGLKLWRQQGMRAAILSGRKSRAVAVRAKELGITPVFQGRSDK